jgi:hypothetical protein
MTIKYVDDDSTLLKLLMLGKDFHDTLRQPVYKQALLRSSQDRLKVKRPALWLKILEIRYISEADIENVKQDYYMHRRRADKPEYLPKLVSDAIEVDVARSFNHMKELSPQNLNNILKAYATVNRDSLDYC